MLQKVRFLLVFLAGHLLTTNQTLGADVQADDYLLSNYALFFRAFEEKDVTILKDFFSPHAKVGQEIGVSPAEFLNYVDGIPGCRDRLIQAMLAGCRKHSESEATGCVAPPQAREAAVIYVGPSLAFSADSANKRMTLKYAVCGSD